MSGLIADSTHTMGVFQYANDEVTIGNMDTVATGIRNELLIWERADSRAVGLVAHFDEHYPHHFGQVSAFARNWVTERLQQIRERFERLGANVAESVLEELTRLEKQINDMQYPFEPYSK